MSLKFIEHFGSTTVADCVLLPLIVCNVIKYNYHIHNFISTSQHLMLPTYCKRIIIVEISSSYVAYSMFKSLHDLLSHVFLWSLFQLKHIMSNLWYISTLELSRNQTESNFDWSFYYIYKYRLCHVCKNWFIHS